jgi:nitrite reductase (NO-forming)
MNKEPTMKTHMQSAFLFLVVSSLLLAGCGDLMPGESQASAAGVQEEIHFTLETGMLDGRLIYKGVAGEIDGLINPDLVVKPGVSVRITLINGDNMPHDVYLPDFDARSLLVVNRGDQVHVTFRVEAGQAGTYVYYCTQPGHRQAGQEGRLIVEED